jgi:pimeloyl-ACP methyl ester carboxylesterase
VKEFKTGSVTANGLRFGYLEAGEGPLVLCLHGFPDHARSFRFQLDVLAQAGYRAVAPFMRGYSPTQTHPRGQYQTAALAQDAVALIGALGYERAAAVFGHDWGAVAASGAAILAPERIDKLITAAVPHGPGFLMALMNDYDQQRRSWYMFFFQQPFAEAAVAADDFRFLERLWADWSPGWQWEREEMEALKRTFAQPGVLEATLGYYRCALNPALQTPELSDLQQRLATAAIDVPALALHGADDGCIGANLVAGMEAFFARGVRVEVIPGAGHFLHQERPQVVNRALLEFLER